MADFDPVPLVAQALGLPPAGVARVLALLAEGNTVPFIARYRKEVTGGLDEVQIREIRDAAAYRSELEERRAAVRAAIAEQGKLTAALDRLIGAAETKAALEDLYLPYKKKRRTKATVARERGLEPLAAAILAQGRAGHPERLARDFVDPAREVPDAEAALEGARHIVSEQVAEHAAVRAAAREALWRHGLLTAKATPEAKAQRTRFEQYYDYAEPVCRVPGHRYLAVRRGESEGALRVSVELEAEGLLPRLERLMGLDRASPFAGQLQEAVADAWRRLLKPSVTTDVRVELKTQSDQAAVGVFARNLRELLLAAPFGARPILAIDPGLRTGCKVVALDAAGALRANVTVFPGRNPRQDAAAREALLALIAEHRPDLIAVGNGTGGRELEAWLKPVLKEAGHGALPVVSVNEAGASVYSASDLAREEFPDLDLTVRGSISIGRRLQDPLAELVKIDPQSIGVGQYQHDVHAPTLARALDEVVEDCVNHVGVELSTASAALLSRVAGVGPAVAKRIVATREAKGQLKTRADLLKVSGLGPKTYEQCAGFLRLRAGAHPLDASAVHPERYALVERMAKDLGVPVAALVGHPERVAQIDVARYLSPEVGEPTLRDILAELAKPGRDPREQFEPPRFRDDVQAIEDLHPGMVLEGVVTNVVAFGAFVDVGVHQDGLVHVSQLADRFVKDPAEVVAPGQRLTVRVLEVDLPRRRIALSARKEAEAPRAEAPRAEAGRAPPEARPAPGPRPAARSTPKPASKPASKPKPPESFRNNPFATLLKK